MQIAESCRPNHSATLTAVFLNPNDHQSPKDSRKVLVFSNY